MVTKKEFVLFGIDHYTNVINEIVSEVNNHEYDIRLILTEGITNAFVHGNDRNPIEPIYLRYYYDGTIARFEFKNGGAKSGHIPIPKEITDDQVLNEHGRGLFILGCVSDYIEFADGVLVVEKKINRTINEGEH
ncbi:ATP-binding protein [Petroclostridium sp. X23]|jgi:serine/threonine-protein kinase RsbW|uniref:ATP-binding protein n=1 Tax=Petroclostridium sp. X23 TaxID=3045146 RepID=UPI0024ADF1A4|nr:ATP-binding protein [Petroclostridium sp. X23]WHH61545.1 ATP-binding protein [Petroclostridium sp. X23]